MARLAFLFVCAVFLISACSSNSSPTAAPAADFITPLASTLTTTAEITSTAAVEMTATVAFTATALEAQADTPLTATEVFERVSPSIAFIDTEAFTGSGFLIKDGYVVTNAHVVYPFNAARIVFPNGEEYLDIPVKHLDLIADLAIMGPITTTLPPVTLAANADLVIGRDVYLVGYPGEVDAFPQPTISRGLVSRKRDWPAMQLSYLQTDAKIAGGQSGGVLVDEQGQVVGISGNSFADQEFGLAMSVASAMDRVQRLLAGETLPGSEGRPVLVEDRIGREFFTTLNLNTVQDAYWISKPVGTKVTVSASSSAGLLLVVRNVGGNLVTYSDEKSAGECTVSFTTEVDAPYWVYVYGKDAAESVVRVESNVAMVPVKDVDDMRRLKPEDSTIGYIDYPGDNDVYQIYLNEGQEITLRAESSAADVYLWVDMKAIVEDDEDGPIDDDTGKGVFGTDAAMTYRAPAKGSYFVGVGASQASTQGAYSLTVSAPTSTSPTAMAPDPTPTPIASEWGQMKLFTTEDSHHFSVQYPGDWKDIKALGVDSAEFEPACEQASWCVYQQTEDGFLQLFVIVEETVKEAELLGISQSQHVEAVIAALSKLPAELRLIQHIQVPGGQQKEVDLIEYTVNDTALHEVALFRLEGNAGLRVLLLTLGYQEQDATPELNAALAKTTERSLELMRYIATTIVVKK